MEVKTKFEKSPEILVLSFKQIKQKKILQFVDKVMEYNTSVKKNLTMLESEFLKDGLEMEIIDQEL